MTREQLLEKFDTATGWSTINPIEVLHIARKEFISLVAEMEELIAKDKLEYKRGWRDRAAQSDLEDIACKNCRYKDGGSGGLTHCSYFEQFMPTEIGKCDIWESKNAR